MKIRFATTPDDVLSLHKFFATYVPVGRRERRDRIVLTILGWVLSLIILLIMFYIIDEGVIFSGFNIKFIIGYIVCLFINDYVRRKNQYAILAKEQESGLYQDTYCIHELEITDEALIHRNGRTEDFIRWEGIEQIGEDIDHAFVIFSSFMAHIIPRKFLIEGEYQTFVAALKAKAKNQ